MSAVPWLWIGLCGVWVVVIFATDQPAWPLALWIAATIGLLTALTARLDSLGSRRAECAIRRSAGTPSKGTER